MKLTKEKVKRFEAEQKKHGTQTALYNVFWEIGSEILKAAGVKQIKTSQAYSK
jgi:hypothetical protein